MDAEEGLGGALDPEAECIEFRGAGLDDAAVVSLAELLKANTCATVLDLSDNHIGDAGARCLAEALRGCPTLTTVDLSGNPVGDAGALALAAAVPHCPALRTVDLTGTLASPAAVEHLRAALTGRTTTVPAGGTVDDLRRELQRLDEGGSDLFEKADLALEWLARGDPPSALGAVAALEELIAASRPRDVLDLHTLVLARLPDARTATEFAGLARLLGRMLQQFTKHEGRQWPPVFDAVARALAARAAVRDNRPEVALPPSPINSLTEDDAAESAPVQGDFYRRHRDTYVGLAAGLAAGVERRPWAHRAMLLRLAFALLRAEVCSRAWPAARLTASAGLPALPPEALQQLTAGVLADLQPLLDVVGRTGVTPLFVLHCMAQAETSPSSLTADQAESGDDFSDFEADLDVRELTDVDASSTDCISAWDVAGVGLFCFAVHCGRSLPSTGVLLRPEYVLRSHLPALQALLATDNLTAAHLALLLLDSLLAAVPKYSVRILEPVGPVQGGEAQEAALAAEDLQTGEPTTTSPHFEEYFAVAQRLGTLMALCPSQGHRQHTHGCLLALLSRFAERTRHKLLVSFLKLCPYAPVRALGLTLLKDEVRAEYQALGEALQRLPAGQGRGDAVAHFSETSAFLHPGTAALLCDTMAADVEDWTANIDPLMAALNLYRYLLGADAPYQCLGTATAAQRDAVRRRVLDPLAQRLEAAQGAVGAGPQVLGGWMLLEVLGSIREKLG